MRSGCGAGAPEPQWRAQHRPYAAVFGRDPRGEEGGPRAQHPLGHRGVHGHGRGALQRAGGGERRREGGGLEERDPPARGHRLEEVAEELLEQRLGAAVATTAAAARVRTPRMRLWRARAPVSTSDRVASSVMSRSRAPAAAAPGLVLFPELQLPVRHRDHVAAVERPLGFEPGAVEQRAVQAAEIRAPTTRRPGATARRGGGRGECRAGRGRTRWSGR